MAIVAILAALVFGQNMDSREGDSLALVAIKKANPGSKIGTITGAEAWVEGSPISNWRGVKVVSGRVDSLYLNYSNLTTLPEEIGNLTNLKVLSLYDNKLPALSAEVWNLTNLTSLYLARNQLVSIPLEIGNLINLTSLTLFGNKLESLPAEIGNLKNLTSIIVAGNLLTSLPVEIGNLNNLTELYLSDNTLTSIPSEIGNLTNLTLLDLYKNKLTSLPAEIGHMTNLQELRLAENELMILPNEITSFNAPFYCSVDWNYLAESQLTPDVILWLNKNCKGWQNTQKDPSPILPTTIAKTVPLTATISGRTLTLSQPVGAGSSVNLYDLTGRVVHRSAVIGSSAAIPSLARGIYVAEILAGGKSVVQKVSVE